MIVEAVDGEYYLNPICFGDRSYLTFENGFPEVIVRSKSWVEGKKVARRWGKVVEEKDAMRRSFPPTFQGLKASVSFRIELAGPIPIPDLNEGRIEGLSPGKSLTWTAVFTREEILSIWSDEPNQKLVQWMCDLPLATGMYVTDVVCLDSVRRRIKEQVLTLFEIPEIVRLKRYPKEENDDDAV